MADDSGMDWEPGVGVRSPSQVLMYLEEQLSGYSTPTGGVTGSGVAASAEHAPSPAVTPAHNADTTATHYLVIDTNVFLSRFDEVRALHDRLAAMSVSAWILLPGRVVAELDGLKSSIKPNPSPARPDESLGETARRATNWLLSIARGQLRGGRGRVRGQKRTEQQAAASKFALASQGAREGDDDILFCCLYFADLGTPVSLWTDDRILSLRAETEHVSTFPANEPLPAIARSLGVEWNGDECMEIDTEPITDAEINEYPIFDRTDLAMPPPNAPREGIKPGEWAREVAAARGNQGPAPRSAFASAMSAVARQPPPGPVTTAVLATPQALTGHLVEQLNALDSSLPPGHELQRPLARSIASARTLNAFFGPPPARGERRVRAGETADAFIVLAQQLAVIGVPGIDVAQWRAVADGVRVL
ncbi:Transcriptional protein swt1 [Vanrija pseudolonga]|uniref:Transcriptional protein swt1 n=1 Tax=Vanrija pseudolonga TaxID=143232 RepID=A0AAF0XZV9_9TREE|nr:Transcriptional protein swt1 [Vanrija pseudolonga]